MALADRIKRLETETGGEQTFVIAYQDNPDNPDAFTVNGETLTRAEVDALSARDNTTVVLYVCYDQGATDGDRTQEV